MSLKLRLKQYQLALLEIQEANIDPDSVHIPGYVRRGGWAGEYARREHRRSLRKKEWLQRRIAYLKKHNFIERVQEGDQQLLRLTLKGKFEVLRLGFLLHMQQQHKKRWDGNLWLGMFDVPEEKRAHRHLLRRLFKAAGFVMLQRSIWASRYCPRPALDGLLKYLGLDRYVEILEVDCRRCSKRFRRLLGV